MNHRRRISALLAAVVVASCVQAATSVAQPAPTPAADRPDPVGHALERLRGDAATAVRVQRDPAGDVAMVRSTDGRALLAAPAGTSDRPQAAARAYLDRYGPAFRVDGARSTVDDLTTLPSATGGTVVRGQQNVDGVPVFGGQVVMSLDRNGGLVSVSGATAAPVQPDASAVTIDTARRTAVAVAAKAHRVAPNGLQALDEGRWLYDPSLVGASDPIGPRTVWRFEITDGGTFRELVLVDAERGQVALHYDETEQLDRVVCNDNNAALQPGTQPVPECTTPVRTEGAPATGDAQVDAAYANIGEASDFYQQVAHLDLGNLIGTGAAGSRTLQSWVRWCDTGDTCPLANAFWDGAHMVLGDGYATGDDVVVHELTHGVIDHTSQLFYLHQSGAINESLADVMGEIADHRNGTDDDSAWLVGEDVPGGAIRSLKNPPQFGQPDSITSRYYDGVSTAVDDSGAVHQNSGVGNKAAYLISQGGSLNGVTVSGIDAGDPTLTKTATLYGQVLQRLTSGAQYADLAHTLVSTCQELAANGTAGFVPANCDSVSAAVAATRMTDVVPGAAPVASEYCPLGTVKALLFHDDDGVADNTWSLGSLWTHAPDPSLGVPGYASSGASSWFGFDPDPQGYGDPSSSSLMSTTPVTIPVGQQTYLHFHHAYVFEWYDATATQPALYPDGGRVQMYTSDGSGWAPDSTPLSWTNGPDKTIEQGGGVTPWQGFGGDSHGYGSSQVDLTPLAGKSVRPVWTVAGDSSVSLDGWWVDDIEIYTCKSALPSAPRGVDASGSIGGVDLRWAAPEYVGDGVFSYEVQGPGGKARWFTSGFHTRFNTPPATAGKSMSFTVTAHNMEGNAGPSVTVVVHRTSLRAHASSTRVRRGKRFVLSGRLTWAGTSTPAAGQLVQLQRLSRSGPGLVYKTVLTKVTRADGTVSGRLTARRTAYYRLRFPGGHGYLGVRSPSTKVRAY